MNLPNKLSLLRIVMVPLFVVAYFLPFEWSPLVAFAIFVLAAFTDFLDGYIARKYNLVSDLGKLLDPIADKILVCAALFCVAVSNPLRYSIVENIDNVVGNVHKLQNGQIILAVCGALVLSRELLIDAVRMIAASKGTVVQANVFGKVKTIFLNVSLPILVALEGMARVKDALVFVSARLNYQIVAEKIYNVASWIGLILFALAIVMTVLSGIIYILQNKKVFSDKKDDQITC